MVLVLTLVSECSSLATTIYVPDDYSTIQDAIDGSQDGDTIIVRAGTYRENIDYYGKAITLTSEDGPAVTVIDGSDVKSVVSFHRGEGRDSVLSGFTITNGQGNRIFSPDEHRGGGIYCVAAATITGNIITENYLPYGSGGGIYCKGDALIEDNEISSNSANFGGGIRLGSNNPIVSGNYISGNFVYGTYQLYGAGGGGIYCSSGKPTITGNLIQDNECSISWYYGGGCGGGIFTEASEATVERNLLVENIAGWSGGGIYLYGSEDSVSANFIFNNSADSAGGGVCIVPKGTGSKIIYLQSNMIVGLNSSSLGGGVYIGDQKVYMTNNTVVSNVSSGPGGGVYVDCENEIPEIRNCIVWANAAHSHHSLYSAGPGDPIVEYCDIEGGYAGTGNIDSPPEFVDPQAYDFHLKWSSPCKDRGSNTAPGTGDADFEGDPRIHDGTVDMGADEFHPHLYHLDDVVAGAPLTLWIVGTPADPATLALGAGIQDPPQTTQYGYLWLQWPIQQLALGSIPADGILSYSATVPGWWLPGEIKPLQALVGPLGNPASMLTNPDLLVVE